VTEHVIHFVIPFADEFRDDGVFWQDELLHDQLAWGIVEEINANDVAQDYAEWGL
jgi:hypothetical protein